MENEVKTVSSKSNPKKNKRAVATVDNGTDL